MTEAQSAAAPKPADTRTANILYIMHGISPFTFWTLSVVAVIIGALTRDAIRGTWVESHYSWLLRTFAWGILWLVVVSFVFFITIIGILFIWIPWGILTIWYLYRVIRGWLLLNEGKPAPL